MIPHAKRLPLGFVQVGISENGTAVRKGKDFHTGKLFFKGRRKAIQRRDSSTCQKSSGSIWCRLRARVVTMSTPDKDWNTRWDNPPHGLRSSQKLLSFGCVFVEVYVYLWLRSATTSSGRVAFLENGLIAIAIVFVPAALIVALSIMTYGVLVGELLWAGNAVWQKTAALLLSGAMITWFIDRNWQLALVTWQIGVLALGGAFAAPLLLALFDVNTKFFISKLYRGGKPLRYYVVCRWNSGSAS